MPAAPTNQTIDFGAINMVPHGQSVLEKPQVLKANPAPQTMTTPESFKQRIVTKYPEGITSDGKRYTDMDATELTQRIVSKYPDGKTNDGHNYADFLQGLPSANVQQHPIQDFAKSVYSGVASPVLNMIARPGQAAVHLAGDQTPQSGDLPIGFGATAHINDPYEDIVSGGKTAKDTLYSDAGRAAQTVALGLGPVAGGAAFGGGAALEQNKSILPSFQGNSPLEVAGNLATDNALGSAVTGGLLGKGLGLGTSATGSVIGGIGKGVKAFGSGADALYSSAQKNIEHVLAPTTKANKLATEKLAPQAARQGLPVSLTRNSLLNKLTAEADKARTAIDTAWSNLPAGSKVDVKPILSTLTDELNGLKIKGASGDILPSESESYYKQLQTKIDELSRIADEHGQADPQALREYRQSLDSNIAKNKSAQFAFSQNDTANMAGTKLTANTTRNQIAKQVPGVAGPNKQFNFFNGLGDILDATITRKTGQGTPMGEKILEGAGATGGFVSGGLTRGIEYAILAKVASKVMQSTAWNTASAAAKKTVADAIAAHDGSLLSKALSTGFNLAGTGLEHVGNFIKGIPQAAKTLPRQNIPGTSAAEIKAIQPGLSTKDITKTSEFKDAVAQAIHQYDTTPATVNGKPHIENAEAEVRIAQLQEIVNRRALSADETKEAYHLLGERGLDPMKPTGITTPQKSPPPTTGQQRPRLGAQLHKSSRHPTTKQPRHPLTQKWMHK